MSLKEKTRSTSRFGMKTAFLLSIVLMVGFGAAVLLDTYGTITGTATDVEQSVILTYDSSNTEYSCEDNICNYPIANSQMYGGSTHTSELFTLKNNANNDIQVVLTTTVSGSSNGDGIGCDVGESISPADVTVSFSTGVSPIVPADSTLPISINTTFAHDICPGTYMIVTSVKPVTV